MTRIVAYQPHKDNRRNVRSRFEEFSENSRWESQGVYILTGGRYKPVHCCLGGREYSLLKFTMNMTISQHEITLASISRQNR